VIATFCEVMATMNPSVTDFRITMDNLNRFMGSAGLSPRLRQRLRDYFFRTQHLQRTASFRGVLLRMSPTLQGELLWQTNKAWLARIPWLSHKSDPGFLVQLVLALKPMVFAPAELATSQMLYIIHRGVAIYSGRMLRANHIWGEDCLLASEKLRSRSLARAMTYLEVYMISRAELLKIAVGFSQTYKGLRRYTIKVALRRGLLLVTQKVRNAKRAGTGEKKSGVLGFDGSEAGPVDEDAGDDSHIDSPIKRSTTFRWRREQTGRSKTVRSRSHGGFMSQLTRPRQRARSPTSTTSTGQVQPRLPDSKACPTNQIGRAVTFQPVQSGPESVAVSDHGDMAASRASVSSYLQSGLNGSVSESDSRQDSRCNPAPST
jgi:hypothetical protein